jgi:soluble lytic murein transglycosylase
MKNELAEKAYRRVIRLSREDSALTCRARFGRAQVVARQRDFDRAASLFDETAKTCRDPNLRVRSLYRGAKAYYSADMHEEAIRMFGEVESAFGSHSFADDARLRAAKCYLDLENREKFTELLLSLPELYPGGDMRAEALWTLAHDAIVRKQLVEARDALLKYFELFPIEEGWYAAGRSGYWLGRVEELIGTMDSAKERYEHVISTTPLSFYMILAYNRLTALDGKRAEALLAALAPKGGDAPMRFAKTLLDDFPSLATGVELQRLGLLEVAKTVFDHLFRRTDLPADTHWVVAQIQRQSGDYHESRQTAALADSTWKERYPAGGDLSPWALAYPMVFENEVLGAAETNGISSHLIWAVMREESGFDPKIESWANAIGLMQLILPTARSMGKTLGIRVNRRTLRRPDVNISLGTAYLKHLGGLFNGHPVLTVAGYNAGEGAVARWLQEAASKDIDVFVEQIPYEQTRGYTKRVLSTYATYHFLYGEGRKVLDLPMTLP